MEASRTSERTGPSFLSLGWGVLLPSAAAKKAERDYLAIRRLPSLQNETASSHSIPCLFRLTRMSFATTNTFLPTNTHDERGATSSPAVVRAPPVNGPNVTQTVSHSTTRPWGATSEKMAILESESRPHDHSRAFARYVLTWTVLILAPQAAVSATSTELCV